MRHFFNKNANFTIIEAYFAELNEIIFCEVCIVMQFSIRSKQAFVCENFYQDINLIMEEAYSENLKKKIVLREVSLICIFVQFLTGGTVST